MPTYPPAQTQHQPPWEGDSAPPLRMRDEKASVLAPEPATMPVAPEVTEAAPQPKPARKGSWFERNSIVLLFIVLFSIPAYYIASRFVVTAVIIQGRSMMPTLKDGERYYLNRWRYMFVSPKRGEIVVIKDPGHNDFAVKRVIAQPFDWLNLKNGMIYVNGSRLDEPYLDTDTRTDSPDLKEKWIQLGRDQFYVMGDNRANSEDSRFYGRVYRRDVLGMLIK